MKIYYCHPASSKFSATAVARPQKTFRTQTPASVFRPPPAQGFPDSITTCNGEEKRIHRSFQLGGAKVNKTETLESQELGGGREKRNIVTVTFTWRADECCQYNTENLNREEMCASCEEDARRRVCLAFEE